MPLAHGGQIKRFVLNQIIRKFNQTDSGCVSKHVSIMKKRKWKNINQLITKYLICFGSN